MPPKLPAGRVFLQVLQVLSFLVAALAFLGSFVFWLLLPLANLQSHSFPNPPSPGILEVCWPPWLYAAGLSVGGVGLSKLRNWARFVYAALAVYALVYFVVRMDLIAQLQYARRSYAMRHTIDVYIPSMGLLIASHVWLLWYMLIPARKYFQPDSRRPDAV